MNIIIRIIYCLSILFSCASLHSQNNSPNLIPIAKGWAKNSVNAAIFRRNSVVSHKDLQYVAFYDSVGNVVLAKRKLGEQNWEITTTQFKGNIADAHNVISLMVDGEGYLHMAWDHHNSPLRYSRSLLPASLQFGHEMVMTGKHEQSVTYPEFHRLPGGDLLFLYRDGESGRGNLVVNHYDVKQRKWTQLHDNLISGQGQRNAYWQTAVDESGTVHLSWVWRETWDVATNHDLCYARSTDGGRTWQQTSGKKYDLPITAATAEYASRIPQNSELINQTSMCADATGRPYIVTYWRPPGTDVPQYHLVYFDGAGWQTREISQRTTPFSLSGGGTKRIPISRPQVVVAAENETRKVFMIFRDAERDNRVSAAICDDVQEGKWRFLDLTTFSVGQWEPTFDTELWKQSRLLHLFVQYVGQGDAETTESVPAQPVYLLEWQPE